MQEISSTTHVQAPPEALYDLVSDVTRMGDWSPECHRAQWLDGVTEAAVGARFKGFNKRKRSWATTSTITSADRGHDFAFAVGKPDRPQTRWRYTFEAAGDGTDVTETCEIVVEPGAFARWLTKVGTGVPWSERPEQLRTSIEQTLANLKAVAEAPPTEDATPSS
jgi:ribosome-associated toxin RatA of RatAB toxin-antitoxin module